MKLLTKFINSKYSIIFISISFLPLMGINIGFWGNLFLFVYFILEFIINLRNKTIKKFWLFIDIINLLPFAPKLNKFRILKIFRIFKFVINSKGFSILKNSIRKNKTVFIAIIQISLIYMLLTSLLIFSIEPQTFDYKYYEAFYWAGITLTTVGYGAIYPVTLLGQYVALLSSFIGIGIIALPTGIIGASLIKEIEDKNLE